VRAHERSDHHLDRQRIPDAQALAGAVSARPQAAGTASGFTGFFQMGLGALSAQLVSHMLDGATTAPPMVLVMLAFGLAGAAAFVGLVRRA
jgi:MFS transporter, DHA1 family, multidrug resistance protein